MRLTVLLSLLKFGGEEFCRARVESRSRRHIGTARLWVVDPNPAYFWTVTKQNPFNQSPAPPAILSWLLNRLANLDLNSIDWNDGPVAKSCQHLAHENTAKSRAISVTVDRVADVLGWDDELLDSLLVKMGLG
jgi:hypothetical protein